MHVQFQAGQHILKSEFARIAHCTETLTKAGDFKTKYRGSGCEPTATNYVLRFSYSIQWPANPLHEILFQFCLNQDIQLNSDLHTIIITTATVLIMSC